MQDTLPPRTTFSKFEKLLTITAVDESDQGKYMCMASNSAGKASHYFDVIVEGGFNRSSLGFCGYICFDFSQLLLFKPSWLSLTSPRAAKVADRAT